MKNCLRDSLNGIPSHNLKEGYADYRQGESDCRATTPTVGTDLREGIPNIGPDAHFRHYDEQTRF
jgi:hypothetical protein